LLGIRGIRIMLEQMMEPMLYDLPSIRGRRSGRHLE